MNRKKDICDIAEEQRGNLNIFFFSIASVRWPKSVTAISTSFTAISISSSLASLSLSLASFSGSFWPFKMNDMAKKFEIQISKPKNNLPPAERKPLKDLKNNTEINIKKADKGTTSVFMSLADKTEGQIQLDNIEHYRPLDESMVEETSVRVEQLITELYREQHVNRKWLKMALSNTKSASNSSFLHPHKNRQADSSG